MLEWSEKRLTLQEQVDIVNVQGDGAPVHVIISGVEVRRHDLSFATSKQHGTSVEDRRSKETPLS